MKKVDMVKRGTFALAIAGILLIAPFGAVMASPAPELDFEIEDLTESVGVGFGNNLSAESIPGNMAVKKHDSTKSYAGYTYFSIMDPVNPRTVLIDMEGKEVHSWPLGGVPSKMLPGGSLIGSQGFIAGAQGVFVDTVSVVQVSWDGEVEWEFDRWSSKGV